MSNKLSVRVCHYEDDVSDDEGETLQSAFLSEPGMGEMNGMAKVIFDTFYTKNIKIIQLNLFLKNEYGFLEFTFETEQEKTNIESLMEDIKNSDKMDESWYIAEYTI